MHDWTSWQSYLALALLLGEAAFALNYRRIWTRWPGRPWTHAIQDGSKSIPGMAVLGALIAGGGVAFFVRWIGPDGALGMMVGITLAGLGSHFYWSAGHRMPPAPKGIPE